MSKQAISLQRRLVKSAMFSSIAAGIVGLILLLAFSVYQNMDTQDNLMDEISDMLLISDLSAGSGRQVDELSDEFEIAYQLKFGQQLLTQSENFPLELQQNSTFLSNDKYAFIWHDQGLWRSYQAVDAERQLHVRLYQPISERFSDFFQHFAWYGLCLLLLWGLQWGLLHFSVKKQFRSIHRLSRDIAEKNADDLEPIQQQAEFIELQPMVKQLNLLLERLQRSLITEQRLTADASHELRSPLSAIQMRLQVLRRKYANQLGAVEADLILIQRDVERGTQILENLLLLARLDPTQLQALPKSYFDFDDLIYEVVQSLELSAQQKQVELLILSNRKQLRITQHEVHDSAALHTAEMQQQQIAIDSNQTVHPMLLANRELLFICIRNLLDNAIRYCENAGHVYIDYQYLNGQLIFSIEDDGQQMNAEILARLGERFYRALGTKTQGSGLGLSICKKVVELHQAKIEFKLSEYGGLAVVISMPNLNI
mgnify:CR=1 FL=1